jgi:hypothetical protein
MVPLILNLTARVIQASNDRYEWCLVRDVEVNGSGLLQGTVWGSGRQPMVRGPLMVCEKILVVRGEIWTLFAIFVY